TYYLAEDAREGGALNDGSRAASVLVANASSTIRIREALDAQVLEGLAAPDGAVCVRDAGDAGAIPEVATRFVGGAAISVGRAFYADARRRRADGPPAARAIRAGLAGRSTPMRLECTDLAGRALRADLALDAGVYVEIAYRDRWIAIGARRAARADVQHEV